MPAMDLKHLDVTDIIEICTWSLETSYSVVTNILLYCYGTCLSFFKTQLQKDHNLNSSFL